MVHKTAYDSNNGKGLKILTPKQMSKIANIALVQGKVGNASENVFAKTPALCIEKTKFLKKLIKI